MIRDYIATHGGTFPSACRAAFHRIRSSGLFKKILGTFGTRILMTVLGLATSVIIARLLGPQGRGYFATIAAISGIGIQFGNLGLHSSNTYYVSKDKSVLPAMLGNTLLVSLGAGSLCALA